MGKLLNRYKSLPPPLKLRLGVAAVTVPALLTAGSYLFFAMNYAGASWYLLKSPAMWNAFFAGDVLLPLRQIVAYPDHASVARLIRAAALASLAELALVGGIIFAGVRRPWELRPPEGGAELVTMRQLAKAELLVGAPGTSMLLGTAGRGAFLRDVRTARDGHLFVNGPTRSGKGRGFVMTNLMEWTGSAIVFDMKFENYIKTGAARRALGQECFVFAPGTETSHRWNPLDFVRPWPARATDLDNLAAAMIPAPDHGDAYWVDSARGLFAGVLGYVKESSTMEGRRTLRSAIRMFSTGKPFVDILKMIIEQEPDLDVFITDKFRQHMARDEKNRPSFESHITVSLSPFNNRLIAAATASSDFNLSDLRKTPFSLFIGSPVADFRTVEPIIRLLIDQINGLMTRQEPGEDEPYKVVMMLDEFYQFERLPEIIRRTPIVASFGLIVVLITQNVAQVIDVYGKPATEAFLGNMDVHLYIAIGDDITADFVSEKLGQKYAKRISHSRQGGPLSRSSVQIGFEAKPLLSSADLQKMDDRQTLLYVRGLGAAILNKLNFYEDRRFLEIVASAEALHGKMTRPVIGEDPEWPLFAPKPKDIVLPAMLLWQQAANETAANADVSPVTVHKPGAAVMTPSTVSGDDVLYAKSLADTVYIDTARLMAAWHEAMADDDNRLAAVLLGHLRQHPEFYGPLHAAPGRFSLKALTHKPRQAKAIAALRDAIIALRRQVDQNRVQEFARTKDHLRTLATLLPQQPASTNFAHASLARPGLASADLSGASIAGAALVSLLQILAPGQLMASAEAAASSVTANVGTVAAAITGSGAVQAPDAAYLKQLCQDMKSTASAAVNDDDYRKISSRMEDIQREKAAKPDNKVAGAQGESDGAIETTGWQSAGRKARRAKRSGTAQSSSAETI